MLQNRSIAAAARLTGRFDRPYDVIIVGAGAAGLSAALVLGRARRPVLVIDEGQPRNAVVDVSHGFLTRDGERPADLIEKARLDIAAYPSVEFVRDVATTAAKHGECFSVDLSHGETAIGKRLLLATGVFDVLPEIDGLRERWGRSVFVCPFCDGWELRDQRIAVFGPGREAVELAQELHGWTTDLVICMEADNMTDHDRRWIGASGAALCVAPIRAIADAGTGIELAFADVHVAAVRCDALFLSAPLRQHSPLFAALGCKISADDRIEVDANWHTSISGCYAAGDSATKRHQIIVAAASGAEAAITINCNLLDAEASALANGGCR